MTDKISNSIFFAMILMTATTTFATGIASVAVGIGTVALTYRIYKDKKIPPEIDDEILKIFFMYLSLEFMVALGSIDPIKSFREFGGEVHRLLPIFFALISITNPRRLQIFAIAFLISCLMNDCYAFYQHFHLEINRVTGLTRHPTLLSSLQLAQIPMLIFFATRKIFPMPIRILSILTVIGKVFVLMFTLTRGAVVALLICGIVFVILDRRAVKFFGIVILILIMAFELNPQIQNRLETLSDMEFATTRERKLMWNSAFDMFIDYPLHGIGQSMFEKMYNSEYISPDAWERPDENGKGHTHPHNNFFKVTCEGGILGLSGFIILHGYFFSRAWKINREDSDSISVGIILFILILGVHLEGLTDTNLIQTPILREYWLSIGTLLAAEKFLNEKKIEDRN